MTNDSKKQTLFEKIWNDHLVNASDGSNQSQVPDILYIDCILIHEVTSPQAFSGLRDRGLVVKARSDSRATVDHAIPTRSSKSGRLEFADALVSKTNCPIREDNARQF